MEACGYNGQVTFDGHFVTITRRGFVARTAAGRGEKRIAVSEITAVTMKPATHLMRGFIRFTVPGSIEFKRQPRSQNMQSFHDENTVQISGRHMADFEAIRDAIEVPCGVRAGILRRLDMGRRTMAASSTGHRRRPRLIPPGYFGD